MKDNKLKNNKFKETQFLNDVSGKINIYELCLLIDSKIKKLNNYNYLKLHLKQKFNLRTNSTDIKT
jgi:hypothetical protein